MNEKTFKVLIISLSVIALVLIIMACVVAGKEKKEKKEYSPFSRERKNKHSFFEKIYNLLDSFPLTRRPIRIYSARYEIIYPEAGGEAAYLTIKLLIKIIIISAIILLVIFGLNPGLFTFITALMLSYIFAVEQICGAAAKMETAFLSAFDRFVCEVRHCYYKCGSVKDSLFLCIPNLDKMMKGHAEKLYSVLDSTDVENATEEYMSSNYHKYLKLFLSMAEMVDENGDLTDAEGSVFLNSCMQLRNDVQEERRYIEERRHRFSALSLTAGIPVAAVPFIADWGVSTIPSLVGFYRGHTGLIIKAVLLVLTYVCFCAIVRLREGDRLSKKTYPLAERIKEIPIIAWILKKYINKNYGKAMKTSGQLKRLCEKYDVKTFYMHKWLSAVAAAVIAVILLMFGHAESREILLNDVSDISNLSTTADGAQIKAMENNIPKYVKYMTYSEEANDSLIGQFMEMKDGEEGKQTGHGQAKDNGEQSGYGQTKGNGEQASYGQYATDEQTARMNEIREAYYKSGTGFTKGGYKGVEDEERVKMQLLKDMTECMMNEKGIRTIDVAESASKEVIRRVDDWESEHFGPEDVIVMILAAMAVFCYPTLTLKLRSSLSENKMQDEVLQFQSVIHMLKKVPGMSAMRLMEEMERFSDIFRPALQQCINEYAINENKAFERLYEAEHYPGFRRIVDCFMLVDEMGTEDAFDEISAEITNFRENRKLERTILLDNEGMLGTILAVIPGGVILFGYLLCPFMIRSVQIFNSYQNELSKLAGG